MVSVTSLIFERKDMVSWREREKPHVHGVSERRSGCSQLMHVGFVGVTNALVGLGTLSALAAKA